MLQSFWIVCKVEPFVSWILARWSLQCYWVLCSHLHTERMQCYMPEMLLIPFCGCCLLKESSTCVGFLVIYKVRKNSRSQITLWLLQDKATYISTSYLLADPTTSKSSVC